MRRIASLGNVARLLAPLRRAAFALGPLAALALASETFIYDAASTRELATLIEVAPEPLRGAYLRMVLAEPSGWFNALGKKQDVLNALTERNTGGEKPLAFDATPLISLLDTSNRDYRDEIAHRAAFVLGLSGDRRAVAEALVRWSNEIETRESFRSTLGQVRELYPASYEPIEHMVERYYATGIIDLSAPARGPPKFQPRAKPPEMSFIRQAAEIVVLTIDGVMWACALGLTAFLLVWNWGRNPGSWTIFLFSAFPAALTVHLLIGAVRSDRPSDAWNIPFWGAFALFAALQTVCAGASARALFARAPLEKSATVMRLWLGAYAIPLAFLGLAAVLVAQDTGH
jgi:hypothetical protein